MSDGQAPPEAALIIAVPEAERIVTRFRIRFHPSAAADVPAHITINYPFLPHLSRPVEAQRELALLFAEFAPFDFALTAVRSFSDFVYLAPEPVEPFVSLIGAVFAQFPDSPPYGGQFEEIIPHLTVGQVENDMLERLREEFTQHTQAFLPVAARASEVLLMDNVETVWKTRAVFPLGSRRQNSNPRSTLS